MKYLAIALILFSTPAFASDLISVLDPDGVVHVVVVEQSETYTPPEPVDTSVKIPEFIKKMNVIDWGVVIGIIPGLPSD